MTARGSAFHSVVTHHAKREQAKRYAGFHMVDRCFVPRYE
jgi:hypothetical protein